MELSKLLEKLDRYLVTAKRDNGDTFFKLAEGAPEYLTDAIREAHDGGNLLPDDLRYEMIAGIASALGGYDDPEDSDSQWEALDGLVPVYTHELTTWLASNNLRQEYVNQAKDEGLVGEDADLCHRLMVGYFLELQEVLAGLVSAAEDIEDPDGEALWEALPMKDRISLCEEYGHSIFRAREPETPCMGIYNFLVERFWG